MSTTQLPAADALSDQAYRLAADQTLSLIEQTIDRWLEEDTVDVDCARSGGMLTLTLPDRSQVIVNTQPPLKELWIAARSGGYHFKWMGGQTWLDTKSARPFMDVLGECLSQQSGRALSFQ